MHAHAYANHAGRQVLHYLAAVSCPRAAHDELWDLDCRRERRVDQDFPGVELIDDIRKYEATLTNLLGAMNDFVLAQPPKPYEGDNKLRMISAIPVTDETLSQLKTRFNVPKFNELFGMTECNLPVARPFDAPEEASCSGKVWDDYFEVIIGDPETDEELPVGEVGEILVRPKSPTASCKAITGCPR